MAHGRESLFVGLLPSKSGTSELLSRSDPYRAVRCRETPRVCARVRDAIMSDQGEMNAAGNRHGGMQPASMALWLSTAHHRSRPAPQPSCGWAPQACARPKETRALLHHPHPSDEPRTVPNIDRTHTRPLATLLVFRPAAATHDSSTRQTLILGTFWLLVIPKRGRLRSSKRMHRDLSHF